MGQVYGPAVPSCRQQLGCFVQGYQVFRDVDHSLVVPACGIRGPDNTAVYLHHSAGSGLSGLGQNAAIRTITRSLEEKSEATEKNKYGGTTDIERISCIFLHKVIFARLVGKAEFSVRE